MALGTPVSGTVAYSANSGPTVSPAYPAGILATDVVVLFVGQKPVSSGAGSITTPTGWTLRDQLDNAGGYTSGSGADTGVTNLRVYTWNNPVADQTGNLSVAIGGNSMTWAFMARISTSGGTPEFGSADGQRTTAPTAGTPFTVALTDGASATNFQAGDIALWAMCIPTDVTTPNQFSAQSVTATGATFATAVELNEPDSATGNDIGGYSAYAHVASGSSTVAPSVTVTAAGTVTNVRGPVVMVRLREVTPPAQGLTPDLYTNTNQFFTPTVTQVAPAQTLTPALYTNTSSFFSATADTANTLVPVRYDNISVFYGPSITQIGPDQTLTAARYDSLNVFYSASLVQSGGTQTLEPELYTNTNSLFSATVGASNAIAAARYDNVNVFYAAILTASNDIAPALFENENAFYPAKISYVVTFGPYVEDGYVDAGYIGLALQNTSTFYQATSVNLNAIVPPMFADSDFIFPPVVSLAGEPQPLTASLFTNTNTFFPASIGATPIQPILGGGSLVRPRKKFRPAILFDFPEPEIVLPDASAKAVINNFSVTVGLGSVVATSPDPINSRTSLAFTQIETYMLGVRAESSWNDPSDDELLFILDFALD